ncbi:hypothetical protein [Burkholderia sp. Ac-20349]|uniref:hypothetical protein n=1 Tax=Burkholderia sp. Ac-20349 TaxID=2703893 RepID=UPI00197C1634|nr:hypothetical protein [Burkholderia sp. Ac-20349]MBN3839336.1 hypothetical protein [Burkholderia sp. Ac-20349]
MNAKTEAIAIADAHLNNAGLPTYSELLAAATAAERKLNAATVFSYTRAKWRADVRDNELAVLRSVIDRSA